MAIFKRKPAIALVEIHGIIGAAVREPEYSRLLDKIGKSGGIGALVLDIDSPGGSASASDLLYDSIRRLTQRKPVIAYIRGLGASGGYYIACGADTIIASRAALVGSIGVIYLRPILQQLLDKIGVELSIFKAGRLKDMSAFWRHPTDEEAGKFQHLITQIYDLFLSVVRDSRHLTDEQTRDLATGEIYTAEAALENRLIDRHGNLDDAISEAIRLCDGRRKIKRMRPKRPFMERFTPFSSARQWRALADLATLTTGGLYFIDPGFLGNSPLPRD